MTADEHQMTPLPVAGGEAAPAPEVEIRRVLVVAPHPDDETLTAGALVAALASRCQVTLVTCTRGERGEMIGSDLAHLLEDPAELAGYRVGELERALTALGVVDHLFLDTLDGGPRLVDSGMRWEEGAPLIRAAPSPDAGPDAFSVAAPERAVAALAGVIDRVQPDLVLLDEPGGGYGHPDHRRTHEVTMAAAATATHRPALVAWVVRPESAVRAAQQWLRSRSDLPSAGVDGAALSLPEPEGLLPSIVVPDSQVDVEIDVTQQLPRLFDALRAHRSQVQVPQLVTHGEREPAAGWYALSNGLLQPIHSSAWLRLAPGWGDPDQLRSAVGRLLGSPQRVEGGRWFRPTMIVFSLVLGAMVAAVGTTFHRVQPPWGLLAAFAALAAGGVLARTFVDRVGQVGFGVAAVVMVFVMTYVRPGGDVLVTGEPIGLAWLIGSIPAALLLPALLPRRWFAES
ncbi:PIG-L family deacetylase [Pseudactinotalea suaedae]|uniref:PIG-L family deacetylase n=1 Tax=Pseudactinotalea suaedae TaxID=1524924 RepID=UPI0012E0EDA5|nr:PIG-L family deacetylase [Pseudactinotalea suaedae]